jgi:ABC-type sugar transport system ATPase subunit
MTLTPAAVQMSPSGAGSVVLRDIVKRFGETRALDSLSFEAKGGAILGIAGPNGAGKSTMVKILAGEVPADSGQMSIDGVPWTPALSAHAVAVVHQEPLLFGNLSVTDNLLVGREPTRWRRPHGTRLERDLLARFGIAAFADDEVASLSLGIQQRVEIVRALAHRARVVLFDEPNSALTADESAALFETMHRLATEGHIVLLVSHRLSELVEHASEVLVILDGRVKARLAGPSLTEESIARAMTMASSSREDDARREVGEVAVRLRGWRHRRGAFGPVDLEAHHGEILAIVGVEGSGAREFVRSVAGLEPASGTMTPGGHARPTTGYTPPDRRRGLFFNLDVGRNLISRLDHEVRGPLALRSGAASDRLAREWMARLHVKAPGPGTWIGALSGGNQQKVLAGAAMAPGPAVLVLEEPTRGVDIGSKRDIYRHLREYATGGAVVMVFCTEIPEVFQLADRCLVMVDGRLSASLDVQGMQDEQELAAEVARQEVALRRVASAAPPTAPAPPTAAPPGAPAPPAAPGAGRA